MRRRKHEQAAAKETESFLGNKKTNAFFPERTGRKRTNFYNVPAAFIQTAGDESAATGTVKGPPAKTVAAPQAKNAVDIKTLRNEIAATVFAEAIAGQETDIAWIYYNLIIEQGAAGLNRSSAFVKKSDNFKIAMVALGSQIYAPDALRDPWVKSSKVKEATVQEYVANNRYFKSVAAPRIASIGMLVDQMISTSAGNPYPGWTGQGNLNDFNNVSKPNSRYWKMARAYYWLQESKAVTDIYVKTIGSGDSTQFIFNGKKIEKYYQTNALPENVPPVRIPPAKEKNP